MSNNSTYNCKWILISPRGWWEGGGRVKEGEEEEEEKEEEEEEKKDDEEEKKEEEEGGGEGGRGGEEVDPSALDPFVLAFFSQYKWVQCRGVSGTFYTKFLHTIFAWKWECVKSGTRYRLKISIQKSKADVKLIK